MRILLTCLLAFAFAFTGCQTPQQKKEKLKRAELKKKAKANLREEGTDVDFQAFLGRLRKAVAKRDVETLKSMMTSDFGYKLDPPMAAARGFLYLGKEKLLSGLDGVLSERFVKKNAFLVAPPHLSAP